MSLSIGIVGLPNVGKSTLFNALTRNSVDAANYPFCTIDPSVGVVPVPDERLESLNKLSNSEKMIPAVVEFVDIAGLVEGASKGEGLGNKFLSHIREVDAIAQVVRVFEDDDVAHVSGKIDPVHDINIINLELVLADMQSTSKRLGSLEKEIKSGDKSAIAEKKVIDRLQNLFEEGSMGRSAKLTGDELGLVQGLNLLSLKPILYVLNIEEGTKIPRKLSEFFTETDSQYVVVNAKIEEEMKDMDSEEKAEFKAELGASNSHLDDFVRKSYDLLALITFLTTGDKESRAWTTLRGSTAPEAGSAIHSDFHDKFIRADVIGWKDLVDSGGYAKAREKGLVRTEGKEYIVQDGDVVEFKI